MKNKRQPADHKLISDIIQAKIFPSIHDAQDDLADIIDDYELSAPLCRNLIGVQKELIKAEKSLSAARAVVSMEMKD